MFLLRVVLRNRWIAGAAFVAIFLELNAPGSAYPDIAATNALVTYGLVAFVIARLGLLSFAVGVFIANLMGDLPITLNTSAPYFGEMVLVIGVVLAMCVWAFHTATAGSKLWSSDAFN